MNARNGISNAERRKFLTEPKTATPATVRHKNEAVKIPLPCSPSGPYIKTKIGDAEIANANDQAAAQGILIKCCPRGSKAYVQRIVYRNPVKPRLKLL
jgi:hypothetical protein